MLWKAEAPSRKSFRVRAPLPWSVMMVCEGVKAVPWQYGQKDTIAWKLLECVWRELFRVPLWGGRNDELGWRCRWSCRRGAWATWNALIARWWTGVCCDTLQQWPVTSMGWFQPLLGLQRRKLEYAVFKAVIYLDDQQWARKAAMAHKAG